MNFHLFRPEHATTPTGKTPPTVTEALLLVVQHTKLVLQLPRVHRLLATLLMQEFDQSTGADDWLKHIGDLVSNLPPIDVHLVQGLEPEARCIKSPQTGRMGLTDKLPPVRIEIRAERVWHLATSRALKTKVREYRQAFVYLVFLLVHEIIHHIHSAVQSWGQRAMGEAGYRPERLTKGCWVEVVELSEPFTARHPDIPVPNDAVLKEMSQIRAKKAVEGGFHFWVLDNKMAIPPNLLDGIVDTTTPEIWDHVLSNIEAYIANNMPQFTADAAAPVLEAPKFLFIERKCEVFLASEVPASKEFAAFNRWEQQIDETLVESE